MPRTPSEPCTCVAVAGGFTVSSGGASHDLPPNMLCIFCCTRVQVTEDKAALFAAAVKERQPYYAKRIELFEKYHAREEAAIEAAKAANVPIKITLPDGAVKEGIKGATTPLDVANGISKSLAKKTVVAKVDGEVWDVFRPLEGDCAISLHSFDEPEGKEVSSRRREGGFVWDSSSCRQ